MSTSLVPSFGASRESNAQTFAVHSSIPDLFTKLAVKYNINIIGGSHFTVEGDDLYNISFLFRRDGTLGKRSKLHITPTEQRWWGIKPGKSLEVFETDKGKIQSLSVTILNSLN